MRADIARGTFGVGGTGVTVGALSDSFNCLGGAAAGVASAHEVYIGYGDPGARKRARELIRGSGVEILGRQTRNRRGARDGSQHADRQP